MLKILEWFFQQKKKSLGNGYKNPE